MHAIALKLLLVASDAWCTMDAFGNHRGSDTRAARMPIAADVLSRPRLVDSNPEVAAHAERVLALVRGLADARRARAGYKIARNERRARTTTHASDPRAGILSAK